MRCARQRTCSLADAEDVLQEAFVRYWRRQRELPGEPMALLVTAGAGRRMTARAGAGDAVILKPLRPTRRAAVANQAETTSSIAARLRNAAVTSDTTVPKNKPRTKPMADWTAGCIILRTIAVAFSAASALIPAASNFTV